MPTSLSFSLYLRAITLSIGALLSTGPAFAGLPTAAPKSIPSAPSSIAPYQPRFGRPRPVVAVVGQNVGTELADFVVPYGILTASNAADVLALSVGEGPMRFRPALRIEPGATIAQFDQRYPEGADYLVVPAAGNPEDPVLLDWIRAQARKGATIISICDGALVVAKAGIFKGHRATGHWATQTIRERGFPDTTWLKDTRYVADDQRVSSAGVTAAIPLSLALVEAFWEQSFFVQSLPMRCRHMIDEAEPLAPEGIDAFWKQLQAIHEKPRLNVEGCPIDLEDCDYANAIAGGIALLVRLHPEWLGEDPQRVEWCRSRIQEIVWRPPEGPDFDVPESVGACTWDCFAAEVLPGFWAKEPDDEALRILMARLVFAPHYSAVAILFRRCSELRSKLGQEFARLRRLALEGAYLRSRNAFVQHSQQISGRLTEEEVQEFNETLKALGGERFDAFYRATSEPHWEKWADLDAESLRSIDEARRMGHRDGYLDLKMVCNAHMWLPRLGDALDAEERHEWVLFWREALAYVLSRAAAARREHNFPNEEERWIIRRVAGIALEMTYQEDPEAIWSDVLRLPDEAHHWVEDFLRAFHEAALPSEPVPEPYVTRLGAILEAVFPKDSAPTRKWSYHNQVWESVVGIDGFTRSHWQPRHEALVARLSDLFERWWERVPACGSRTGAFARWLEMPAASAIRLRGITWIERRLSANADGAFDLEDCSDAIASLLAATWPRDEARLRADAPAFLAFRNLLRILADDQNELALDLLGRLGGLA